MLQQPRIDLRFRPCWHERMGRRRSQLPPDPLPSDIVRACEHIHAIAKAQGLTLKQLGKRLHSPFQSFENWKGGHHLPKIEGLQVWARGVGANVRVWVQHPSVAGAAEEGMPDTLTEIIAALQQMTPEDLAFALGVLRGLAMRPPKPDAG